jgi:hypothetical protein
LALVKDKQLLMILGTTVAIAAVKNVTGTLEEIPIVGNK